MEVTGRVKSEAGAGLGLCRAGFVAGGIEGSAVTR